MTTTDGLPDQVPTPDMDRREYAKLPVERAGRLRAAWRNLVGSRATAPNGAPFPLRSWPPDAAIDIQALAEWADPMKPETVRRFADAAARDAAIPAPTDGMLCYLINLKQYQGFSAGKWAAVAGLMPFSGSAHAASQLFAAGWLGVGLSADAGAGGGGGWPAPTLTGFTLPAASAPMRYAYTASLAIAQAGVKATIGWGDAGTLRVIGPTVPATAAGGFLYISGSWIAQPGTTYYPYLNAGVPVDVSNVYVRIDATGPA